MFLKINSQLIGQTPLDLVKKEDLNDFLQQIRGRNAIFVVSCDPIDGYAAVTDEAINQFAAKMAEYNQYGIPVLIRPAHEMNGPWYAWGQQPTQYIAFHRKLHTAVRKVAPKTQFVFAPNLGVGYPWTIGEYHIQPTSPDFRLVDTNRDGVLSILDDPYTPYWPGGEYVDWFGFSTYYKGVSYPYVQNEQIPSDFVAGQLDQVLGGRESTYGFAARRNLPIVIPEMAGSYGIGNPGGLWFDYLKFEDNALRDFTISNTTTFAQIGPFFQADLTSYPHMLYESNLTLSTSGNCGCFRYNDRREALGKVPTTSSTTTTWTNTRTRETSTETDPGDNVDCKGAIHGKRVECAAAGVEPRVYNSVRHRFFCRGLAAPSVLFASAVQFACPGVNVAGSQFGDSTLALW
ncbi:hypothetical protein HK102_003123 [Quaeritorhiza haematococci]|nr:hypothetical protein HK102_003123 [Quaeritorhiza haematococci]